MTKIKDFFKNKKKRNVLIVIILVIVITFTGLFFVRKNKQKNVVNEFSYVRTVTLSKSSLSETIVSSGTIESQTTSSIAISGANASVSKVNYVIGDYVEKGDVVIELDTSSIYKQITKVKENITDQQEMLQDNYDDAYANYAEAYDDYEDASNALTSAKTALDAATNECASYQEAYNLAKNDLDSYINEQMALGRNVDEIKRDQDYTDKEAVLKTVESNLNQIKNLTNYDSLSKTYEQASQTLSQAKSKLSQTKSSYTSASEKLNDGVDQDNLNELYDDLSDYKLKAKTAGQITSINAVVGSTANGTLATIQDTSKLKISLTIDEYDILKLKLGMKVQIETDASDQIYEGEVSMISPTASSSMGSSGFEIEVKVTSDDVSNLLIGMNAEVTIIVSSGDENYNVPVDAVETQIDGTSVIYVEDGEEFKQIEVTLGDNNGYYVEIFSDELYVGMKVRASANEEEAQVNVSVDDFSEMGSFNFFGGNSGGFSGGGNDFPNGGGDFSSGGSRPSGGPGGF